MGENDLGIFLGHFRHVIHVAVGVAEDDLAAGLDELQHGGVTGAVLGHVGLDDDLVIGQAQGFLHGQQSLIMGVGVTLVAHVTDEDEANLDVFLGHGSKLRAGRADHPQGQHEAENPSEHLFHVSFSSAFVPQV